MPDTLRYFGQMQLQVHAPRTTVVSDPGGIECSNNEASGTCTTTCAWGTNLDLDVLRREDASGPSWVCWCELEERSDSCHATSTCSGRNAISASFSIRMDEHRLVRAYIYAP